MATVDGLAARWQGAGRRVKSALANLALMALAHAVCACGAPPEDENRRAERAELEQLVDSLVSRRMAEEEIPGAAFVLVQDGQVLLKKGYGYSNTATGQVVDPDSTIFRIGSITKTFTATAVMQLVEQGRIDLHADVNSYLRRVQVPTTFDEPVTPHHLLSHTAGFDEIRRGRLVFSESDVIPLADFLQDRLVRIRPPGRIPAYSTYGIALAGVLVEDVSGQGLESYLERRVWRALGMDRTSIKIPPAHERHRAVGYELVDGVNQPQAWEWYHTFPASDISSTPADMAKYMLAHLGSGAGEEHPLLGAQARLAMQTRQATGHPRINGFGYGFHENSWRGQRTVEHGGDMRGFSSLMVLLPEHDVGFFVVHHHEGTNLRYEVAEAVIGRFFAQPSEFLAPTPPADFDERADRFTGTYTWLSNCRTCANSGGGVRWTISSEGDGTLSMIGRRWIEVEPLFFLSDDGNSRLAFLEDSTGAVRFMFLGNVDAFERIDQ